MRGEEFREAKPAANRYQPVTEPINGLSCFEVAGLAIRPVGL